MAQIFTSNQVNHVLVATSLKTSNGKVASTDNVGTISVQKDVQGNMYFMHKGNGGLTRSDLITNIMNITYTPASKMFRSQNAALITINANALTSSKPFSGQDYVLNLEFQNPVGISPDHKYWKHAAVHATANMTTSNFYKKMAKSLAINMSREAVKLVNIYLFTSSTAADINTAGSLVEVDANPAQTLSGTYYGIKIVEAQQEWILGVKQDKPIIFKINNSTINDGTEDIYWADVLYSDGHKITGGAEIAETIESSNLPVGATLTNSHLAAELEYFAMGERADLYRNVGWPDVVQTKYIVDSDNEYGYDMINIHYAYVGSNHAVQKSEKDLTIIVPRVSTDNDSSDELNAIGALAESIKGYIEEIANPVDTRYPRLSGALTSGNVPEFDGTDGVIKDSGKAASAI